MKNKKPREHFCLSVLRPNNETQQVNVNMTLHYNFNSLICVVQWMYSASRKLQEIYI